MLASIVLSLGACVAVTMLRHSVGEYRLEHALWLALPATLVGACAGARAWPAHALVGAAGLWLAKLIPNLLPLVFASLDGARGWPGGCRFRSTDRHGLRFQTQTTPSLDAGALDCAASRDRAPTA